MRPIILLAVMALAACNNSQSDQQADRLENAAEQSDPAAAAVLDNAAEAMREGDPADPQAAAQNAMQAAGTAQVQPATPDRQAVPHRAGDPVPPPTSD